MSLAERKIQQVISLTEADMQCHGNGARYAFPGRGSGKRLRGYCGSASDILSYFARINSLNAQLYQNEDVHSVLSDEMGPGGPIERHSFTHGFSIIGDADTFLADLTFGQFCAQATIKQGRARDTGISSNHSLARELIANGYIRLTDESLRQYLQLTIGRWATIDLTYIRTTTVQSLRELVLPLESDFPDHHIETGFCYHLPQICQDLNPPCGRPNPVIQTTVEGVATYC